MTQLERQIRAAQYRLWLNRWLSQVTWCIGAAATAYAVVVLVQRLFDLPIPLFSVGIGLGATSLLVSIIWTILTRESGECAAARLDEAAGLRERLSSGRYCMGVDDPFARAVVADAEGVSSTVTPRMHLRLDVPRPLAWTAGSIGLAALMFLISPGLLKTEEAVAEDVEARQARQTKVAVKRKLDEVKRLVEATPALEDLKDDAKDLDQKAGGRLQRPEGIRNEAAKKIDKLADAVKKKRRSAEYESLNDVRRMMRRLDVPKSSDAPTQKLANSLRKGDFKTAKEEIKRLQEQLATLKMDGDKEAVKKLSKQLQELAKQLEKLPNNEQLAKKLQKAGLKKEDVERMLANLKKKDLDQIRKQLEKKGLSKEQAQKLAQQMKRQQRAGSVANKLSKAMQKGAQSAQQGQMGEAIAGLSQAGGQLGALESLEQEMNQLDSTLAELEAARSDVGQGCSACNGTGMVNGQPCGKCQGRGRKGAGMSRGLGQGRGGLAPERRTAINFKTERTKVHTGKGAIVGQFLVEGEQVKGDVSKDFSEIVTAAERDASDRINRHRVPRQYQKTIKRYFSDVRRLAGKGDEDKQTSGGDDSSNGNGSPSKNPQ